MDNEKPELYTRSETGDWTRGVVKVKGLNCDVI